MRSTPTRLTCGILLILLVVLACDGILPGEDLSGVPRQGLHVRIRNGSSADLENVIVEFPTEAERYGDVASGEATSFRRVERAYRYAYVEAIVRGEKVVLQPVDYVGESLLEPGAYTYELDLGPDGRRLQLRLIEE